MNATEVSEGNNSWSEILIMHYDVWLEGVEKNYFNGVVAIEKGFQKLIYFSMLNFKFQNINKSILIIIVKIF